MLTPRPRPSPIPMSLIVEDDAGYESGKESKRNVSGNAMVRPKLKRADSSRRKVSALMLARYRQKNFFGAPLMDNLKLPSSATSTCLQSSSLSRPARPTRIDLSLHRTEEAISKVSTQYGRRLEASRSTEKEYDILEADSSNSSSLGSSPESDLALPPKPQLKPVLLPRDDDLSPISDLPPLLVGSSSDAFDTFCCARNVLPLPAMSRDSVFSESITVSAYLTLATAAQLTPETSTVKERPKTKTLSKDVSNVL